MRIRIVLIFALSICLFSCKKDSQKGSPDRPYFLQMIFENGDTLFITEGLEGVNSYGRGGANIDSNGTYFERQSTSFTKGSIKATIYFMQTFPAQPDSQQIHGMFHESSYTYGSSLSNPPVDGIEILWRDSSGVEWNTSKGNQLGSSFQVTGHKSNVYDNFTPYVTSATFSCNLFNDSGDSIRVEQGSFTGRTVVYP